MTGLVWLLSAVSGDAAGSGSHNAEVGMGLRVRTNNVPRFTVEAHELSPAERAQHDYLNWRAIDAGEDSATFVRYRGWTFSLGDFERTDPAGELAGAGWDGYYGDSYFSGTVIRFPDPRDSESVVMGSFVVVDE